MYPETTSQPQFNSQRPTLSESPSRRMYGNYISLLHCKLTDFYNYIFLQLPVRITTDGTAQEKKAIHS